VVLILDTEHQVSVRSFVCRTPFACDGDDDEDARAL